MLAPRVVLVLVAAARSVAAYGCASHTFGVCEDGITHWYDEDDGQICDPLDCGGGRAPPKYDVPCCAQYTGTEPCVTTPSYMPCFKATTTAAPVPAEPTSNEAPNPITTTDEPVTMIPTTQIPTFSSTAALSTTTQTSTATSNGTTTTISPSSRRVTTTGGSNLSQSSSATPSSTPNAAGLAQCGSLIAVAGAIVGAALL